MPKRGTFVAPASLTVGEYLDRWIDAHEVGLKPSTAISYRANVNRYLRPALGHERLQSLSPSRLSVLFRDQYEHGGKDKQLAGEAERVERRADLSPWQTRELIRELVHARYTLPE